MALQGFDKDYYLNAKLEQLQNDPATSATWAGKTADFLESKLLNGFGLTAEQHYEQYGYQEGLAPNAYFDPQEYIQAKAVAMVNDPASSYTSVDAAAQAFVDIWGGNVYQHYLQYGASEGINPSNSFDASAYLEEKLAALQAAGETQYQTADDVKAALAAAGLTPLDHFLEYGQQEGLSAPAVPADEQVTVDNSVAGETFTLTAGADTPATTSGDDTINALTIDAQGTAAETFSSFDTINGGAGTDTLNIYTTATLNEVVPTSATVKNVEIVNLYNSSTTADEQFGTTSAIDASKFVGAQQIWQIGAANNNGITNVASTTTAGFRNLTADNAVGTSVAAATGATSVSIALDAVKGNAITNDVVLGASGDALSSVNVSGNIAQQTVNTTAASLALSVTAGKDVETLSVNTGVKTTLSVTEGAASTKEISTVDASASTGDLTYTGTVTSGTVAPATIKTGSGNDTATIAVATLKDDAATTATDETRSALLETGAGNDGININTSGTGTTTVNAGEGNDTVTLTADGSGKLSVNLGAGNDIFKGAGTGAVNGTDTIDGGEGTDTLTLNMVGSANIGAFSNFETFDVAGLGKTLDVDILSAKNTVTEFVTTGDVANGATLTNVGANVGYRVIGDTDVANALTLTQKAAGPLTVTLDIDETGTTAATTAATDRDASVVATNANSINAVFDSAFVGKATGAGDNATDLNITGSNATSLDVVSGGENASNNLDFTSGNDTTANKGDLLTSVTITGSQNLSFTITENDASEVMSVDASALTGALTFSTAELKAESATNAFDGGSVKLGSGDDLITVTQGAKISGIEKGTAEDAAAQSNFDIITTGGTVQQAADVASTGSFSIKDGLFTFEGTGPSTLDAAIAAVDAQLGSDGAGAGADGDAVAFEYLGNSYAYVDGGASADTVIQLTGVTGLSGLDEVGTADQLYVF
ncbi:MAG: SEF [Halomonadaceae bacterium T82-2]|nr:MAG: SEF [Halomonadaceae bacterium T82-2]